MSRESANSLSLHLIEDKSVTRPSAPTLSPNAALGETSTELLTVQELAARLRVPESWVRARTRSRTLDRLPVVRLGRYTRFRWSAVEMWLREHEDQACG
jgi:excisionase family DNA binding protein